MLDVNDLLRTLTVVCGHYEKSAPTVSEWANDLYIRINEQPDGVRLSELYMANQFHGCHGSSWLHPNTAANLVYKLMSRMGQETTGHAGF